jgi:hypothetical protein
VVSLKHAGRAETRCRPLGEKEAAARAPHMRPRKVCERARAPVRLRVHLDGRLLVARAYRPGGLFGDGASVAVERFDVPPGEHLVRVEIGETADPAEWAYRDERRLAFAAERRVVLFDRTRGIAWF